MPELRRRFADRERTQRRQAAVIRRLLLDGEASSMEPAGEEPAAGEQGQ